MNFSKTYLLRFLAQRFEREKTSWCWDSCQLTRFLSPPPFPASSPPSPCPGFYDLSGIFKQGPCSSPCLGKIIGMTFSMQKRTRFLPTDFCTTLSCFNEFLFSWKSLLSNINPPLLYSCRHTPSIEPWSAKFLHTVCQWFCQPSEPCLYPCFSILQQTMVKGWRGAGGSSVKR